MSGVLRERSEVEKLRYAMLELTRRALADDPHLRAYVLMLGGTMGFVALCDAAGGEAGPNERRSVTLDGETSAGPDPKAGPKERKQTRIVDRSMTTKACLEWRECPCGKPSATGHHVLAKGAGKAAGDDVLANIVPLCGSGTTGCHGLIENGDEKKRRMLGRWIAEHRPDTIRYIRGKLGDGPGDDWLNRTLFISKAALRKVK